jgi:hypothetical protein
VRRALAGTGRARRYLRFGGEERPVRASNACFLDEGQVTLPIGRTGQIGNRRSRTPLPKQPTG